MFAKVLLSFLALQLHQEVVNSAEDWLHRRLTQSWCECLPTGVGYSRGGYFSCQKANTDFLSNDRDLRGVTIRVGMIEGSDLEYDCSAVTEGNGRVKPKDSYSRYLLTILQDILQFDIKFVSSTSWGYLNSNNTWTGLVGLLTTNATDLIACHWTANRQLSSIADYFFSTLETTGSFVYLPQNLPLTEDVFVVAFSRKLWIFFLLSLFLLVVSFWYSTYMHSRVRPDHEPWSWDEVVLWAIAAISQQSYSRHPRGSSCRTMFLIGYLVTYLFYTGFAAGITSLLALQDHYNRLTFDDVAEMKLHLIFHRGDYYFDVFKNVQGVQEEEGDSLQEIFHKIQQTNFLAFGSTVSLLHYLRKKMGIGKRQGYSVVPVPDSLHWKSFLVQKSSPYKHLFNHWLLRLREIGLLDLGRNRYLKTDEVAYFNTTKWFSVGLGNVFSAVVFLISGWILSILVLLLEILCKKRKSLKFHFQYERGRL